MSFPLQQQQAILYICFLLLPAVLQFIHRTLQQYKFSITKGCKAAQNAAPLKDPFIGIDFIYDSIFGKSPEKYLDSTHKAFEELGSTYTVKRWTWEMIYTRDSRNIKYVLATGFEDFELPRLRVSAMAGLLGSGIFTLNGRSWAHARGVLKPCFAKQDKGALVNMLERHFQVLLRQIPTDGSIVDLQPLFFWLTMDFATEFLMGYSTNVLDRGSSRQKEQRFVDDYLTCSTEIVKKMQLGPLRHFRFSRNAAKARGRVFKYIDGFISDSLKRKKADASDPADDVLSQLAAVTSDRKQLRDQVLHILVASRDTTASLLSNLFFVLARKPGVYKKLREDILAVAGELPPATGQLKQMEYLKWCIQESLRLHPVIPTNAREAVRDTILPYGGGHDGNSALLVKKGTLVMYNIYSMHRDESIFGADPEEFIPERWSGLRPSWGYLPFNGGPRICIGQQFALLEAQYLVARIVQSFSSIEATDQKEWVELYALATSCKDGVNVRVSKA